ncbi:MAG: rod shape-determining protein MreD [Negativicutes bacterium]|nr:rod shape-determining protein MreD [Negativicutes bacterium]
MKQKLFWLLIIVVFLLLQILVLPNFFLGRLKVDLMLLLVIAFALLKGSNEGMIFGLTAGLLCDCLIGQPFGLQIIMKALCGFAAGKLHDMYIENQLGVPLLAASALFLLAELFQRICYWLFYGGVFWPKGSYWTGIGILFLQQSVVFSLIYYLVRYLLRWQSRREALLKK